jgi:hypothetical protein
MKIINLSLTVVALSCVFAWGVLQISAPADASECLGGEKIDGSTIQSARLKMKKAGFENIRDLKKGCDNFWHGWALKDGKVVHIALSPQGLVMVEGN